MKKFRGWEQQRRMLQNKQKSDCFTFTCHKNLNIKLEKRNSSSIFIFLKTERGEIRSCLLKASGFRQFVLEVFSFGNCAIRLRFE